MMKTEGRDLPTAVDWTLALDTKVGFGYLNIMRLVRNSESMRLTETET